MPIIGLISLLTMLIHTTSLAETATTGNLLPNAGTGQTNVQSSSSTIDGINSSTGFTLNNITDYSQNFNELEANGTGTVSASGSLVGITAGDHTTTTDSLDGGVSLQSTTEVQNCEWTGSAYRCGQATNGRDSYSTTVTILDENNNSLATVTQNRNNDSGYYNNTFTYTDTVIHNGEGARNWSWEWEGVDGYKPQSQSPVGPNLLGAELKATLLNILYSPIPPAVQEEITEIFEELFTEFEEIEDIIEMEEEFAFEEELLFEEEVIEVKEEEKIETPMVIAQEIIEEESNEEMEPVFETFEEIITEEKEEKEEEITEEVVNEEEEEQKEENITEEKEETTTQTAKNEEETTETEQKEEDKEEETTETAEKGEKEDSKVVKKEEKSKEKEIKSENEKLDIIMAKIDEEVKDISKNLQIKSLIKLKQMENNEMISVYNIPFYKPQNIYEKQINIFDNRDIYSNITLSNYYESDPMNIQFRKIEKIKQEKQKLLIEIEALKNG